MRRLTIAIALLLLAPVALAQVYKWTDAHGTVHYSEVPPTKDVRYSQITPTGNLRAISPSTAASAPEASAAQSTEQPARASSAAVADTPQNRESLCASLKANLGVLNGKGAVVMQEKGKPQVLDDSQRKQQVAAATTQYAQFCAGQ